MSSSIQAESKTHKKPTIKALNIFKWITSRQYRARRMYEAGSDEDSFFTEHTHYLNMGYWKDKPQEFDDACQAMAQLLAEIASMQSSDRILDVGFGFADQDLLWAKTVAPKEIVGINITPSQVEVAQGRVKDAGLEQIIKLQEGSATQLAFAPASFDKVVGLECAFHFVTREKFFHEAYRVLVPGGRIALIEPIPLPNYVKVNPFVRFIYRNLVVPTPKENLYTRDIYAQKLEKAGFEHVQIISIKEDVFAPFILFLTEHLKDPDYTKRFNPKVLKSWSGILNEQSVMRKLLDATDYVTVVADKPKA